MTFIKHENEAGDTTDEYGNIIQENKNNLPIILGIGSFIFPLLGFYLWLVNVKSNPKKAKDAGLCGLGGFAIGLLISFL